MPVDSNTRVTVLRNRFQVRLTKTRGTELRAFVLHPRLALDARSIQQVVNRGY